MLAELLGTIVHAHNILQAMEQSDARTHNELAQVIRSAEACANRCGATMQGQPSTLLLNSPAETMAGTRAPAPLATSKDLRTADWAVRTGDAEEESRHRDGHCENSSDSQGPQFSRRGCSSTRRGHASVAQQ